MIKGLYYRVKIQRSGLPDIDVSFPYYLRPMPGIINLAVEFMTMERIDELRFRKGDEFVVITAELDILKAEDDQA